MRSTRELLEKVASGEILPEEAEKQMQGAYFRNLEGFAIPDLYRHSRTGMPETIFCAHKSIDQISAIAVAFLEHQDRVLLTRLSADQFSAISDTFLQEYKAEYSQDHRTMLLYRKNMDFAMQKSGKVGLICAGTSDIPIMEEAELTLKSVNIETVRTADVGVAGLHRLFTPLAQMQEQKIAVYLVFAGMEGTLPGIIASLVDRPVIGVPTSTGYGHGERGEGALTTILQSCAPGIATVNIDNGFGAAVFAVKMIRMMDIIRN